MQFLDGDYNKSKEYLHPYNFRISATHKKEGVDEGKVEEFLLIKYSTLKAMFNYPSTRDFRIVAFNINGINNITLGPEPYELAEVIVDKYDIYTFDKYGERNNKTIDIYRW